MASSFSRHLELSAKRMHAENSKRAKVLYFFRGEGDARDSLADYLEASDLSVEKIPVSDFAPFRGFLKVFSRRHMAEYDIVAAAEYHLAFAICLRLIFQPRGPKIAALSFNQSRRLVLSGFRPIDWILNLIWRRASLFLVHSRAEARLFSRLHDIPIQRFVFSHWGYDLPAHDLSRTKVPDAPYVTMVGRNNRDLSTFCAAIELADVSGVLITASYMLEQLPARRISNLVVLSDISLEDCLNYIEGSFAHLVLVSDGERGAGHISAVSAMLLGKPQVFSNVSPLGDYLIDGENGIAVPLGDPVSTAQAIQLLLNDASLSDRLGKTGLDFARTHLSHEASARRGVDALLALLPEGG